jgi:hypothetical protein
MPLYCGCTRCYTKLYPENARKEDRRSVFNALYVNPDFLLAEERSDLVIAASSLLIAVFGAQEGRVVLRHKMHALYETTFGKVNTEQEMMDMTQACLIALERIAPHKIVIAGANINEDELREFRNQHGSWRTGRSARFYSYSIGTILYFSDINEAVMAKFVLDTSDRSRLLPRR